MKIKLQDIFIIFIIFLVVIVQISMPRFGIFKGVFPNLIFTAGLVFLLIGNFRLARLWLILGSAILDFISPYRFGWLMIAFILAAAPIYYLRLKIIHDSSVWLVLLAIFCSSLLVEFFTYLFFSSPLNWYILICAVENSVLGIIFYVIAKAYIKKLEPIKV